MEEETELENCIVVRVSQKAILVDYEGSEIWVPFSQITPDSDINEESISGDTGKITIPGWLARAKGLV